MFPILVMPVKVKVKARNLGEMSDRNVCEVLLRDEFENDPHTCWTISNFTLNV